MPGGPLDTMTRLVEQMDARATERLRPLARIVRYGTEGPSTAARDELTRYLPEGWMSVLESDVDGCNSGPLHIDSENPRFGQAVAGRRVARTIFLGSAPHVVQQQVRGVEDVRLRLAVVQPGEQVSVFNDALSQLSDRLTCLYRKNRRYWYDTRPNLRRTVEERAQQLSDERVESESNAGSARRLDGTEAI